MTKRHKDAVVASVLFVVAVAWTVAAATTIPAGYGGGIGPRGFPLGLGILLGVLSLIMLAGTFLPREPGAVEALADGGIPFGAEIWAVGSTVGLLIGYALLMKYTGFIIATAAAVAIALVFVLNKRSISLVLGMSLGMAFGIYVIFGMLLGVYLPHGSLVDLTL